jgi:CheY-like chemotaxis protein
MILSEPALAATRLVLLTSSGQRGDGRIFAELGFAGYLLKPVTQRDLTDSMMLVLGTKAESWHMRTQPIVTRHALRSQRARDTHHILLAEDNLVNQKVACRVLEKLGYRVDVAPDGRAAVDAWATGRYHLILMDCQMPVMDGYTATRAIRIFEREVGRTRTPIIALTAHALAGERERVLDAGMDEFLSKPFRPSMLDRILRRCCEENGPDVAPLTKIQVTPVGQRDLDPAAPRSEKLIRLFLSRIPSQFAELEQALGSGDAPRVKALAHKIKGSCLALAAERMSETAEALQGHAERGDVAVLGEHLLRLRRHYDVVAGILQGELARYGDRPQSPASGA